VAKTVERLMSSHTTEDLTSSILDFPPVVPENDEVRAVLNMIWRVCKVDEMPLELYGSPMINPRMSPQLNGHPKVLATLEGRRWKLGFGSDDLRAEFKIGGILALDCLVCHPLALRQDDNATLAETIRPCQSGEVCPANTGTE
jgi:hypothetical protein